MTTTKPFYKQPLFLVLGTILLVAGGGLAVYLSLNVGDGGWWRREAEAWNKAHTVPDADNAALLYAGIHIPGIDTPRHQRFNWHSPLATSELTLLASNREALDALLDATKKPACFYPIPIGAMPEQTPTPRIAWNGPKLLVLRAREEALAGHPEAATRTLIGIMRLGFHHQQGDMTVQAGGIGCREFAWDALDRLRDHRTRIDP